MIKEEEKEFILEIVEDANTKRVIGTIKVPIDFSSPEKENKERV